jgi:serine/threonine protein kinase/Tfp pilus assembly protein PilF
MAIPEGTKLGRYEIRSPLGSGGMGEVYLANDLTLHRPVAIKVLRADVISNKDRLRRFELEAFAASSLNHPNILTIYEIGHESEYHFMVTEFIDGESLGQRLKREPLKLPEALEVGIQIASALGAAHAAGITHRDIKPDNIMLRRDHLVKVLDFGLAKLNEPETADAVLLSKVLQVTVPGVLMGTARYMSPEQARGLPVDARTDIWSVGVVLYRMVAGALPFTGNTMGDVIADILTTDPPALTTHAPDVPTELDRIVTKSLRKDQEERYQSVKGLGLDLEALKQRLEFEAELERINSKEQSSKPDQAVRDPRGVHSGTTLVTGIGTDSEVTRVGTTSSSEYVVSKMRRHKLGASLILAAIIAATIALAYFGYSHYLSGSKRAGITSLAVLPFTNTGNDPEKEYLSDGISESLINRLSQLPGVKVIANSSSSRYQSKDADPEEVATALGVTAVLTGRVLQRGDNLSISVELIDGRDRTQLWGQQYNRKATDLLAVQAEISREIAEALRLRLTTGQQRKLVTSGMVKPEAYELLLKGRFHSARGTIEDRKQAGEYFNQAIAADPAYALAYADLSDIYRSLVNSGSLDPKEYLPKAQAAAQKSLELDESLAEGHYSLANLKTYAWQWADADAEYKRAIELNPNLALAHRWYAAYLRLVGKNEQAIAEIKRARELDPLSLGVNATVGYLFFGARQYDQAIEVLKKTLELDQNYPYAHLFLGFTYAAKGMYAEAIAAYQEAIKLGLDTPSTQIHLGVAYARAGSREQAQAILKRLQTSKDHVSPGELAMLYTAMGDTEQAFASLETAYEARDPQLQYLGVAPEFDSLRADPRFQNLLRRVGLTP